MYLPLIEEMPSYLFLIRPRRFGKSLFLSMMHTYYDILQKDNFDKYFGDFSLTATLGTSIQDVNYQYYDVGGSLNSVADGFTMLNLMQSAVKFQQDGYHDQTQSIFATANSTWT